MYAVAARGSELSSFFIGKWLRRPKLGPEKERHMRDAGTEYRNHTDLIREYGRTQRMWRASWI